MSSPRADRGGRDRGIIVVTIDGSIIEGARIKAIAGIIGRARRPVVVVVGGGALEKAIRGLEEDLALSDVAARRMAILAMHQTAMALADLQPRLIPVETIAAMRQALAAGRIPVWLPLRLSDRDDALPSEGSIGADGLAARLAERLAAIMVLLVKPHRPRRAGTADDLAGEGIVDDAFARIISRTGLRYRLVGSGEAATLAEVVGAHGLRAPIAHQSRSPAGRGRRARRLPPHRGATYGKA
jgi:dihydroneopterin aldolase